MPCLSTRNSLICCCKGILLLHLIKSGSFIHLTFNHSKWYSKAGPITPMMTLNSNDEKCSKTITLHVLNLFLHSAYKNCITISLALLTIHPSEFWIWLNLNTKEGGETCLPLFIKMKMNNGMIMTFWLQLTIHQG